MELWVQALTFGLLSALSLPFGALIGMVLLPGEKVIARFMGVGAGAIVYAVATQLYGKTLFKLLAHSPDPFGGSQQHCDRLCVDLFRHVNLQVLMGLLGALGYKALNTTVLPRFVERISAPRLARMASLGPESLEAELGAGGDSLGAGSTAPPAASDVSPAARRAPASSMTSSEQLNPEPESNVALSMWLGLVLDGIPESLMLGFMTNSGQVTFSFIVAVFIANFPEAFAGAAALQHQGMSRRVNLLLWSSVFFLTGFLAMVGSLAMPKDIPEGSWVQHATDDATVVMEGLTGGAMLAMVATAMMPEAYHGAKHAAGDMFVVGFGLSVFIDGLGARFGKPQHFVHTSGQPQPTPGGNEAWQAYLI